MRLENLRDEMAMRDKLADPSYPGPGDAVWPSTVVARRVLELFEESPAGIVLSKKGWEILEHEYDMADAFALVAAYLFGEDT